ncbi:hypothetical protein EZS27_016549 [termite gut metagenome]|uniref:Uncharacterized protein n=1 Tax=termite gut metagenome TaxID=433724 RepID=A0A5J4RNB3_9ZZZZ
MNRQVNEQSKFSSCTIWELQNHKSVYAHLFRCTFMLLMFYAFTISNK